MKNIKKIAKEILANLSSINQLKKNDRVEFVGYVGDVKKGDTGTVIKTDGYQAIIKLDKPLPFRSWRKTQDEVTVGDNGISTIKKIAQVTKTKKIAQEILFKLKREIGNTRVSLENLKKILNKGYKLTLATFIFKQSNDTILHVEFVNEDEENFAWDFTGFSAGYGGEGPKGLAEALKSLGIRKWDMNTISGLKPGNYKIAKTVNYEREISEFLQLNKISGASVNVKSDEVDILFKHKTDVSKAYKLLKILFIPRSSNKDAEISMDTNNSKIYIKF